MTTLIWFRDDLRLADHSALRAAAADPEGLVALYVLDEESPEARPLGGATRWWLHESLSRLAAALAAHGVPLTLRRGPAERIVAEVAAEAGADRVCWNRRYGDARHIDARLKQSLRARGTAADSFGGNLLFEPWTVATQSGTPFQVYTPFWRACLSLPAPAHPVAAPELAPSRGPLPAGEALADWRLQPVTPDWSGGLASRWTPGEAGAIATLARFLAGPTSEYARARDIPSREVGSELSPHLRWGEISPHTVWHAVIESGADLGVFLSELGWREFAWHTAFHHPRLHERSLKPQFADFPWRAPEPGEFDAWTAGHTGFGLVDAGMQELWQTGFMHNRVRMVAASFLTKNLLLDWRVGEAWFWDTLVDADAASNPFNWQWVAGCGADAAPYFRVFNPRTQQQKFDPTGDYVERWAPESVMLPELVDLRVTRTRALAAYDTVRGAAAG